MRVECYAGYRGEEEPRRIHLEGRCVEVEEILDRRLAPDHRYFLVRCSDGEVYRLRHDSETEVWTLQS